MELSLQACPWGSAQTFAGRLFKFLCEIQTCKHSSPFYFFTLTIFANVPNDEAIDMRETWSRGSNCVSNSLSVPLSKASFTCSFSSSNKTSDRKQHQMQMCSLFCCFSSCEDRSARIMREGFIGVHIGAGQHSELRTAIYLEICAQACAGMLTKTILSGKFDRC